MVLARLREPPHARADEQRRSSLSDAHAVLQRTMIVAVIAMRVMQMLVDQVVHAQRPGNHLVFLALTGAGLCSSHCGFPRIAS
jgi:hypothetical protein